MRDGFIKIAFGLCFAIGLTAAVRGQNSGTFPSGGGVCGSDTQLQYNNAGACGGTTGVTYTGVGQLTYAGGTITASTPARTSTQTWNNGAVTFILDNDAVTATASATLSRLKSWNVGGSEVAGVVKDGSVFADAGLYKSATKSFNGSALYGIAMFNGNIDFYADNNGAGGTVSMRDPGNSAVPGVAVRSNSAFMFSGSTSSSATAPDTGLGRNAAGVVEVSSATAGAFRELKLRSLITGGTVPGISGCSAGTQAGGATAGSYVSGTTGSCAVTLTFAFTAPAGWNCNANNQTTANLIRQTGGSTTTAVITGVTVTSDVISFMCMAY